MAKGEKILFSDIREDGNPFAEYIKGLQEYLALVDTAKGKLKGNPMVSGGDAKKAAEDTKAMNLALKDLEKTEQQVLQTKVKVANAATENSKALALEKQKLTEVNRENKLNAEIANAATGSYNKLNAEYKKNLNTLKSMQVTTKAEAQQRDKLAKTINKQNTELKKLDASMGNHQRNVGDYANQIGMLGGKFGILPGIFNQVKAGLNVLKLGFVSLKAAIISTGIGALVIAIASLVSWFKSTAAGAQNLRKVMEPLNAIFQTIVSVVKNLGEGLFKIFSGDFVGGINQMTNAVSNLNAEYQRQLGLQKSLTLLRNIEHKKYIEDVIREAQLEAEIAKQREIANNDALYETEQQIDAIEKAKTATKELFQIRQDRANRHVALLAQESQASADSEEAEKALADAIAASINVQAEASRANLTLLRRSNTLYNRLIETRKQLETITIKAGNKEVEAFKVQTSEIISEIKLRTEAENNYNKVRAEFIAKHDAEIKQQRIETAHAINDTLSYIVASELNMKSNSIQRQMDDAQRLHDFEVSLAGDNATKKAAADQKYNETQKKLRRDQAKVDKEKSIASATIAMFEAIIKATATEPGFGLVLANIIAAYDAVQLARLIATPLPSFRKGTKMIDDSVGMKGIDRDGHIVQVHNGEGILTKEQNMPLYKMGIDYNQIPGLVKLGMQYSSTMPIMEDIARKQLQEQRRLNDGIRNIDNIWIDKDGNRVIQNKNGRKTYIN